MTAIQFYLSVHSIVMAQTRQECFSTFIMYMSTLSTVNKTFDFIQFFSPKATFTLASIFMAGLGILVFVTQYISLPIK